MKKKAKKLTPIQKLRKEIVDLKEQHAEELGDLKRKHTDQFNRRAEYQGYLDRLAHMVGAPSAMRFDRHEPCPYDEITYKVYDLIAYRIRVEGSISPEREHNANLMDIIRWQVNPKTARREPRDPRDFNGESTINKRPGRIY